MIYSKLTFVFFDLRVFLFFFVQKTAFAFNDLDHNEYVNSLINITVQLTTIKLQYVKFYTTTNYLLV